jgi:hypothetical protein
LIGIVLEGAVLDGASAVLDGACAVLEAGALRLPPSP